MNLKNLSAKDKIHNYFINFIKKKRFKKIYKKFENSLNLDSSFAVAVSGGPDSMALVFLSKVYSIKNGLNPKFYIVNHNLRKNSTSEANLVQKVLRKFYINAKVLNWVGKKPTSNLQSISRDKRFKLLFKECKNYKISNILLGHHIDDLYENFFIRILRGSGLKGLISLGKKTTIDNINILRPLLDISKSELEFISTNTFNFFVKDPSNYNEKFQRIKIRKLIHVLQNNGLDKKKFLLTIRNLKYSDDVINFYKKQNINENSFFSVKKKKLIINEAFFQQPHEIIFRSFSELIKMVGKKYYKVRGKKLDKVILGIKSNNFLKVTLGGCIIEKVNQTVILTKESKQNVTNA
tara:strand:+ start:1172 stop:2221 length:1050 start_codon:yes stop_codon:yes gene_type:complete